MDTATQSYEDVAPDTGPRPVANAPQLRTLLLTDLVDSTSLIERIGDSPASELFRAHDRLVLQLQQQWRGRLIDRSDGLLLLFERPIDGLGFALDYARGLDALGAERQLELRARAGLHVGEVLTWRNSDEAVSVGAKPLEVEGLAKPMAARLMAIARPGQILLSAVAEPLAHRAARELGERGQHLLWKSYGRWRFKGVPEPQEIFEVGEPGVAPLRMPPSTPKAWRDIPLWRRPAALAAEVALLAGLATGAWFLTRPAPAIAFNQRDWVVVGDLRNLTGQVALDDSLEQAFRISLEQSRHVNVLSDLKARDTLARMQRPADTVLDRAIASEIALRDGARAVILPTVAEVGGRVRVSAEVIDPRTQTTVYAESADGVGIGSVLESIDALTAALRGKLGEAMKSIEADSAPLPQVTTRNLDALRAYALGQKAFGHADYGDAQRFYERATTLDPDFALAWIGQMRVLYSQVNAPAAMMPLRRAQKLRAHLAPREAMYLDAWAARFDAPADASKRWEEVARLYPDFGPAQSNAAMWLNRDNRFKDALAFAKAAAMPQVVDIGIDFDSMGRAQLALSDFPEAAKSFSQAVAHGYRSAQRRRVAVEAAQRNFAAAERAQQKLSASDRHAYLDKTALAVDQAKWAAATESASTALKLAGSDGFDSRAFLLPLAVSEWLAGDRGSAKQHAELAATRALTALTADLDADAEEDLGIALASALLLQRLGDKGAAERVLFAVSEHKALGATASVSDLATIVRAESARLAGNPKESVALLLPLVTGQERYQVHVALQSAYADLEQWGNALAQARWLKANRGLAYAESTCGFCLQALNVGDSTIALLNEAVFLSRSGSATGAAKAAAEFDRLWPTKDLPAHLRTKRESITLASSLGAS